MPEQKLTVVELDAVTPLIEENGREQIRRLVTHQRVGSEAFSFHITHLDAGHERNNPPTTAEEVLYAIQGEMYVFPSEGGELHMKMGSALYMPKGCSFRHRVGPQGLTMAVVVAPPRE